MRGVLSSRLRSSVRGFALVGSLPHIHLLSGMATTSLAFQTGDVAERVDNLAAILYGIDDLRVENCPISAEVPDGHVRIAIRAVGICGSDVHYWKKGRIADFIVKSPMIIGHESAGEVVALGKGVGMLKEGDRVAIEPGVPCWQHHMSRIGRYNLDPSIRFFATPPDHGSLCQYVDHPEDFCFKLPEGLSYEHGAFCEPLSVGVHACRRGKVTAGDRVAILGAGPIGLVTLICARAFGALHVCMIDPDRNRMQTAKQFGAEHLLHVDPSKDAMDQEAGSSFYAQQLKDWSGGEGIDVIFDCAGFEGTLKTAVKASAPGGRVVLVGMGRDDVSFPNSLATVKEVDVIGSFRYANTYPLCLELLESKLDIEPLITHRFPFTSKGVADGFQTAADAQENGAIKVMFNL